MQGRSYCIQMQICKCDFAHIVKYFDSCVGGVFFILLQQWMERGWIGYFQSMYLDATKMTSMASTILYYTRVIGGYRWHRKHTGFIMYGRFLLHEGFQRHVIMWSVRCCSSMIFARSQDCDTKRMCKVTRLMWKQ